MGAYIWQRWCVPSPFLSDAKEYTLVVPRVSRSVMETKKKKKKEKKKSKCQRDMAARARTLIYILEEKGSFNFNNRKTYRATPSQGEIMHRQKNSSFRLFLLVCWKHRRNNSGGLYLDRMALCWATFGRSLSCASNYVSEFPSEFH